MLHNLLYFPTDYDLRSAFRTMSPSPMFACNQRSLARQFSVLLQAAFDMTSSRQNVIKIAVNSQKMGFLMIRSTNFAV